ncbi:ArfGap-domain-containing protein [Rickenella mellea]|uniref:ArfGap-domain-containing protein n=1 Tax=Rickenella mellea TaxID=50990 RepID=A0A4Y7Q4H3_9AGAM|nr:ArfGap-domain-containing protein [Rickenella mellea]
MSRQDKATTEKHTRMLREMVKRPENKVCADCKRNDPRWASWNIGVFLCIRCSGIHRGMGTHISKVKSIDLDTWYPEQIESIQNWGNHRANLYWEAHLKPGHIPPDHKMESFIRSKYESRRWAMEGPPDPSTIDDRAPHSTPVAEVASQASNTSFGSPTRSTAQAQQVLGLSRQQSPPRTTRQPQPRQLLSTNVAQASNAVRPSQPQQNLLADPPAPAPAQQNDLFSLDFHAPASSGNGNAEQAPKKDVKNDILSLFSASRPPTYPAAQAGFGQFSPQAQPQPADPFGQWNQAPASTQPQVQPPVTSLTGATGTGMWGVQSGWNAAPAPPVQANVWGSAATSGQPSQTQSANGQSLYETSSIWGAPATSSNIGGQNTMTSNLFASPFSTTPAAAPQKKDDAFGDLWGGFK